MSTPQVLGAILLYLPIYDEVADYPATIALFDFGCILFVYALALYFGTEDAHPRANPSQCFSTEILTSLLGIRRPNWRNLVLSSVWKRMMLPSMAVALSLPLLFQALLHLPSLPILAMLFPLIYATESIVLLVHRLCTPSHNYENLSVGLPWHTLITLLASTVILLDEYRLMVPGLVSGILSFLLMGLAKALFTIASNKSSTKLEACHGFRIMAVFFGLVFSGLMTHVFERNFYKLEVSMEISGLLLIQVISVTTALATGSWLMVFSLLSFEDATSTLPINSFESSVLASLSSSMLVILAAIWTKPKIVISIIQFASYIMAVVFIPGFPRLSAQKKNSHSQSDFGRRESGDSRQTMFAVFTLAVFGCAILYVSESTSLDTVSKNGPANLDLSYKAPSTFDIVVSAYHEDPEAIKNMLAAVKHTTFLRTVKPRVILYTKDENADIASLRFATGADIIEKLPNTGREGGTYLHHIVANWDALAEKTMFIQAHAHNIRELIPRIDSYLVADTGMLSLGFTGVSCRCGRCEDRWGWKDELEVIPEIYASIYNHTCEDDTPILLSFKGQFVAGAQRIRGVQKNVYERLLRAIETREGWIGNGTVSAESEKALDNPTFGFTMERIWGLLMQCATNDVVATRCPSLLSGMRFQGNVADCQCLDPKMS